MINKIRNKPLCADRWMKELCEAAMSNTGYIVDEVMTFDFVCLIPYQAPWNYINIIYLKNYLYSLMTFSSKFEYSRRLKYKSFKKDWLKNVVARCLNKIYPKQELKDCIQGVPWKILIDRVLNKVMWITKGTQC